MTRLSQTSRTLLVVVLLVVPSLASAQPAPGPNEVIVVSAMPVDGEVLQITGRNFVNPVVEINGLPATVLAKGASTTTLNVQMPVSTPGTYRLTLANTGPNGRARRGDRGFTEFAVTIGSTGAQGVPGIQGPPGTQGQTGPQGPQGPAGAEGPKGDTGATGAHGNLGPAGPAGPQGLQGDTGAQGPAGPQGVKGDTGAQGPAGPQGERGEIGPTGATGSAGPAGPQGVKGDTGVQGPAGPQGERGEIGPTGAAGSAGPTGPQGVKGDTGAQGPAGPQGERGEIGPTGAAGATGPEGPPGVQGPQGSQGPEGAQGPEGPQGPAGTSLAGDYALATAARPICMSGLVALSTESFVPISLAEGFSVVMLKYNPNGSTIQNQCQTKINAGWSACGVAKALYHSLANHQTCGAPLDNSGTFGGIGFTGFVPRTVWEQKRAAGDTADCNETNAVVCCSPQCD